MQERPVLLSRRAIMGGLLAGAGFVSVGLSGVGDPESVLDAEEYSGDSSEMERRLTQRYGIPIYIASKTVMKGDEILTPHEATEIEKKYMLEFIRGNLAIYPKDFFKKIGLRKMAVYGSTTESTASFFIVGHFLEKRIRFFAHVPGDKDGFRQSVIHHEIAHAVTVNDVTFDEWVAKTHRCTIQEYASISKKPLALGFITHYARKNYIEDMAEVGMWMFDNPKFVATVEQQPDSIFVRKVLLLKARYCVAHEKMGNQYWQDLAAGKVSEMYWER